MNFLHCIHGHIKFYLSYLVVYTNYLVSNGPTIVRLVEAYVGVSYVSVFALRAVPKRI